MPDKANLQFAGETDTKVFYSGPPGSLKGIVHLSNASDEKLTVRALSAKADALQTPARLPLQQATFGARLEPGEYAQVKSTLRLHPQTPPGDYELELNIGGKDVQAIAHVTEHLDLHIQPDRLTILVDRPGEQDREFIIENAGNVPFSLGESAEAPLLYAADMRAPALLDLTRVRVPELAADSPSPDENQPRMSIDFGDAQVLRPGERTQIKASFQISGNVNPQRHYRAIFELYNANVVVDVYRTVETQVSGSKPQKGRKP